MKVSKRGEYGMAALCHLAERHGHGLVGTAAIARSEGVPTKYLESILSRLKHAGFVTSRRGNEGGYALARAPREIVMSDVLRALDGPLAPLASGEELRALSDQHSRRAGFYAVLIEVHDAICSILDRTTLADVVARPGPAGFEPPTDGADS